MLRTSIIKDIKKGITKLKCNTEVLLEDINKSINESTEKIRNVTEDIISSFD